MTLHILNSLSNKNSQFENCINSACEGDDVVFLSNEYPAREREEIAELVKKAILLKINLHLLNPSAKNQSILKNFKIANQKVFLDLAIMHEKSITWF